MDLLSLNLHDNTLPFTAHTAAIAALISSLLLLSHNVALHRGGKLSKLSLE